MNSTISLLAFTNKKVQLKFTSKGRFKRLGSFYSSSKMVLGCTSQPENLRQPTIRSAIYLPTHEEQPHSNIRTCLLTYKVVDNGTHA